MLGGATKEGGVKKVGLSSAPNMLDGLKPLLKSPVFTYSCNSVSCCVTTVWSTYFVFAK